MRIQASGTPCKLTARPYRSGPMAAPTTPKTISKALPVLGALILLCAGTALAQVEADTSDLAARPIQLRCWGVPTPGQPDIDSIVLNAVLRAFQDH